MIHPIYTGGGGNRNIEPGIYIVILGNSWDVDHKPTTILHAALASL